MQTKIPSMDASNSKIKFDESDEYESSSGEEEELERELADVTLEDLQKARSNGFHAIHQKSKEKKVGRANKNRPMEISSKKPVGRFREVIQAPKKVTRDPRFESLCGTLDTDGLRQRYNFLFETELPAEKEELRKLMNNSKDPNVIADLKNRISSIDKQLKAGSAKRTDAEILSKHKKKEREAAKEGKRPYYLKKSEIRQQGLVEKYHSLKAAGKLDSFIEKRRKKNAAKDQRYMPYRRQSNNEQQQ